MSQNPRASLAGNSIHMIRPHLDDIAQVDFPSAQSKQQRAALGPTSSSTPKNG